MNDDFQQVVKYLDISPTSVSDDPCLKQNKGIFPTRAITKIRKYFTMPRVTGVNIRGALLAQVDYALSEDFYLTSYIPHFNITGLENLVILAIRYRIGTTVYRYRIPYTQSSEQNLLVSASGLQAPFYTNQLIKKNFVLEFWGIAPFGNFNVGPVDFISSRAVNPTNPDELNRSFDAGIVYDRTEIGVALPEPIPTEYPLAAYWNNN